MWPYSSTTYDLGGSLLKWRHLYLSGNIYSDTTWVKLDTKEANNSSSIDFTSYIDDTYDEYKIVIDYMRPATDDVGLYLRVAEGGYWRASSYK